MRLQENIAITIRALMKRQNKSLTKLSEDLEISRTALYKYLKAEGNPSIETVEHLAEKLGIAPAALVTGLIDPEQQEVALLLLDTIKKVAELDEAKRLRFAELFLEMVQLWNDE